MDNSIREFIEKSVNYKIREIDSDTHFWMIRTKRGYFFEEFVKEGYVALGWNIITKGTVLDCQSKTIVKESIQRLYGDKRPMLAVNKCENFIYNMKEGDYLIIPSAGSSKIAFAIAGKYYEDDSKNFETEQSVIPKIDNSEYEINQVKCPYRKRRKITILKILEMHSLPYDLRRAISAYHGISSFDDYAESILNSIYDCFSYKSNITFTINIQKKDAIKPREISKLMYSLTEFFTGIVDEDIISTTISLNSPGNVRIKLKDGIEKLTKAKIPLIFLFIAVTGGSAFGFELPGIMGFIKQYKTIEIEVEKERIELQRAEIALNSEKLEYINNFLEMMNKAEEEGVDVENIIEQLNALNILKGTLEFEASPLINEVAQDEK
ncbi:MAG: hypothetical protein Q4C73_03125 [Eubacteriales bacterium]|nr:hypothetical protein [Eubacteriales bacterium]